MAADLNAVKSHINLRGQKLHLSSIVSHQSHRAPDRFQESVLFSLCFRKICIEVSSLYSVCSMPNIKGFACQTMPFHLESTVTENYWRILCVFVCVGGSLLYLCADCIWLDWKKWKKKNHDNNSQSMCIIYHSLSGNNMAFNNWMWA